MSMLAFADYNCISFFSKLKDNLERECPGVKISPSTISRRLKEADLSSYRARKVPLKSRKNLKDRIRVSKKYVNVDKRFTDR